MSVIISVVIGYLLDMLIGTPLFFKKIRAMIIALIKKIFSALSPGMSALVTVLILAVFGGGVYGILKFIEYYNMILSIIAESIVCYICISSREIKDNADRVHKALKRGYIKNATRLFKTITDKGEIDDPKEIAENIIIMTTDAAVDMVIAPLFYILVFGGAGGVCLRLLVIISDYGGKAFPRAFKNVAEIIPVRISVVFMLISAKLLKMNVKNAIKVFKRDRYNVKSLNRGLALSVCAGALGVELNLRKSGAVIGIKNKVTTHNDIKKNYELINISGLMTLILLVVIRLMFILFVG